MDCVFLKVQNKDEENIEDLSLTIKNDRFMSASLRDKIKKHGIFPITRYRLESIVNILLRSIKLRECRVEHRKAQLSAFIFCDFLDHNHAFRIQL